MSHWQRQRAGMIVGTVLVSLVLGAVCYFNALPHQRLLRRPIVVGGILLLVFGPVLIGNYLAGRKGSLK